MKTGKWKTLTAAFVALLFLGAVGCKKKEEAAKEPEKKAEPRPEPRKEPPPRPDKPEPDKPKPPEMKWTKITSEKYGIEFEIPATMKQQTDEKEYLFAWDEKQTAFIAVGAVKNVKKAGKDIDNILKKLKLTKVKIEDWKDITHNNMKGKMATGELKNAKGEAIKGQAAVFMLGKKKNVAFLLLYKAALEKQYAPHVKKLQDSIKPLGAKAEAPKGKEPAKAKVKKGKKGKKKGK